MAARLRPGAEPRRPRGDRPNPRRSTGIDMAARIHYEADTSLDAIAAARIAVLGYGSQGRAHARNLHDSGVAVTVGLRKQSQTWGKVEDDGLRAATVAEATSGADVVAMMVPDQEQPAVYVDAIEPHLAPGA